MKNKAIGILGGMGPSASVYLYKLLIEKAAKDFEAKNNSDFPEIILMSVPVPDFISNDKHKQQALDMLKRRVEFFNKLNVSCLAVACNTAHVFLDNMQSVSMIPFVSMIDAVVAHVSKNGYKKIGILGTPSTLNAKLYQNALKKIGIASLIPDVSQFDDLENVIRHVIKNKTSFGDRKSLILLADKLRKHGAEGIILGCTELPLVFPKQYSLPVYSSIEILANVLLKKYYEK